MPSTRLEAARLAFKECWIKHYGLQSYNNHKAVLIASGLYYYPPSRYVRDPNIPTPEEVTRNFAFWADSDNPRLDQYGRQTEECFWFNGLEWWPSDYLGSKLTKGTPLFRPGRIIPSFIWGFF